jgi:hypothetical protein
MCIKSSIVIHKRKTTKSSECEGVYVLHPTVLGVKRFVIERETKNFLFIYDHD